MKLIVYIQVLLFNTLFYQAYLQEGEVSVTDLENMIEKAQELLNENEFEEALELFYGALDELNGRSQDEINLEIDALSGIATIFKNINFFEDALSYNQRAINLSKKYNLKNKEAELYTFRSDILFYKIESNESFNIFDKKIIEESRSYVFKAIEIYKEIEPDRNNVMLFSLISNTYIQSDEFEQAEEWILKAIEEAKTHNSPTDIIKANLFLARIYNDIGSYEDAIFVAQKTLNAAQGNTEIKSTTKSLHYNLYFAYKQTDNIEKAFFHLDRYNDLKYEEEVQEKDINSITNQRLHDKAKELEKREGVVEKKVKKVRRFNTALLISLLSFGIISFLYFRSQRLKEKNLQLELVKQNQEMEIASINAMMDGREKERKDIGQYLHDHVSALVNTANIQLEVLANEKQLHDNERLVATQSILDDMSDKVRNLSHQLLSNVLSKYGLAAALSDLCASLTSNKVEFISESTLPEGRRYVETIENKLYSVVQELCNNILKHSQASKASIFIEETSTHLHIRVKDNGIGFKEEDIKKGGVGLHQVRTRINSMGGRLEINTEHHTEIDVNIPLGVAGLFK